MNPFFSPPIERMFGFEVKKRGEKSLSFYFIKKWKGTLSTTLFTNIVP
jgi:hypothetical protein